MKFLTPLLLLLCMLLAATAFSGDPWDELDSPQVQADAQGPVHGVRADAQGGVGVGLEGRGVPGILLHRVEVGQARVSLVSSMVAI